MGLMIGMLSLVGSIPPLTDNDNTRMCKVCYGEDDGLERFLRPCKCSGTLQWVHQSCFDEWLKLAPSLQQEQCGTCRHVYEQAWSLKPLRDWSWPSFNLTYWEMLEILLDGYSTYKFIRGFIWTCDGRRAIWVQCLHFLFWRSFIATDRRISFYGGLGRRLLSSSFDVCIKDYQPLKCGCQTNANEKKNEHSTANVAL